LISLIQENSKAYFGKVIRPASIEQAFISNTVDGKWQFPFDDTIPIKDQYGNVEAPSILHPGETVSIVIELIGVMIGKTTIRPAWKLHMIRIYKATKIVDWPTEKKEDPKNHHVPESIEPTASTEPEADEGPISLLADADEA